MTYQSVFFLLGTIQDSQIIQLVKFSLLPCIYPSSITWPHLGFVETSFYENMLFYFFLHSLVGLISLQCSILRNALYIRIPDPQYTYVVHIMKAKSQLFFICLAYGFLVFTFLFQGSWIVKQSVGKKACLIGQALEINYFHGKNYLEVSLA